MHFKVLVVTCLLLVVSCKSAPPPKDVAEENVRKKIASTPFRLTQALKLFNEKMYKRMTELDDGNILYSPYRYHVYPIYLDGARLI